MRISKTAKLTQGEENFCKYFFECKNAAKAYLKAFPTSENWNKNTLYPAASRLLKKERIIARLDELQKIKNRALEKSLTLNKRKLIETALQALNETNTPAERQHFVSILKMLFNKEGMGNESASVQVNINNAPIINEITNYLDI